MQQVPGTVVRSDTGNRLVEPWPGLLTTWLLAALLLAWAGCDRKPGPTPAGYADAHTVSVLLGDPAEEYGRGLLHLDGSNDGRTKLALLEGVACRQLRLPRGDTGYFYFSIDPSFKERDSGMPGSRTTAGPPPPIGRECSAGA
jgi:hypothetical protein